ncbi:hypothetical protein HK096_000065, partial [Nowakowskiella sp. JEL0078]
LSSPTADHSVPLPASGDQDVVAEDGFISTDDVEAEYSDPNSYPEDFALDNPSTAIQLLPAGIDQEVITASVQSWDSVDEYIPPKQPRGRNRNKLKQAWKQEFLDESELDGYAISEGSVFIRSGPCSIPFETLKSNLSMTQPEHQLAVTEMVVNKILQLALSKTSAGTQVKKKRSLGLSSCLSSLVFV